MDGVPTLWEQRYNLSSADSSLRSPPFPISPPPPFPHLAAKTPSSDVSQSRMIPLSTAVSNAVLLPYLFRRFVSSFFLLRTTQPGASSSFFFGSATVPLAARESPLTRRMDDLRISSRSLSPVRSRYRRHPSAHLPPLCLPPRSFPLLLRPPGPSPSSFFSGAAASTGFSRTNARFFLLSQAASSPVFYVTMLPRL